MKLRNTPELAKLNGYMEAMSYCLNGCNYVIWFNAKGIVNREQRRCLLIHGAASD